MRSRHTIRCFLSFSLVLSFKDLYLVLTCIYLNIEDNFNFKLGGMLIVWLFDEFCVVLVDSLETICFHYIKKKIRKMRKRKKLFGLQWCLWFMLYSHASLLSLRIWFNSRLWFKIISEFKHMNTWLFDWYFWTWPSIACFEYWVLHLYTLN